MVAKVYIALCIKIVYLTLFYCHIMYQVALQFPPSSNLLITITSTCTLILSLLKLINRREGENVTSLEVQIARKIIKKPLTT